MSNFVPFNRDQAFLLPPDLKAWLPEDDLAHFVVAGLSGYRLEISRWRLAREASHNITRG